MLFGSSMSALSGSDTIVRPHVHRRSSSASKGNKQCTQSTGKAASLSRPFRAGIVTFRSRRQNCCVENRMAGSAHSAGDTPNDEAGLSDDFRHYQDLKLELNKTTRNFAAGLTAYLALVTSFDVAGCAAVGGLAGYGYLQLLIRDVDMITQDDPVAASFLMAEDSALELSTLRSVRRLGAGYRAALRPRLLVLVGVAAAAAAFDAFSPEPLSAQAVAALFGGFLSYKASLLGQLWEATRPRFNNDDLLLPPRPMIASVTEEERDLSPEEWRQRLDGRRH